MFLFHEMFRYCLLTGALLVFAQTFIPIALDQARMSGGPLAEPVECIQRGPALYRC